jgi:uncharacterized repeat protein (TIGR01451 family)
MNRSKRKQKQRHYFLLFYLVGVSAILSIALPIILVRRNGETVPNSFMVNQTLEILFGSDGILNAGDIVKVRIEISNIDSPTPLFNVTVTNDQNLPVTCDTVEMTHIISSLAQNQTVVCFAMHVLTQQDIDSQREYMLITFLNSVSIAQPQTVFSSVAIEQEPFAQWEISQTYSLDTGLNDFVSIGDVVVITVKLINTGLVDITNIESLNVNVNFTLSVLPPMSMQFYSYNRTIEQADFDMPLVPLNETVQGIEVDTGSLTFKQSLLYINLTETGFSRLEVSHTFSFMGADGCADVGDVTTIQVIVKNTGTVELTNVEITDSIAGTNFVCQPMNSNNIIGSIFPNVQYICNGGYQFVRSDIVLASNTTVESTVMVSPNEFSGSVSSTAGATFIGPNKVWVDIRPTMGIMLSSGYSTLDMTRTSLGTGAITYQSSTSCGIDLYRIALQTVSVSVKTGTITYSNINRTSQVEAQEFITGDFTFSNTRADIVTVPPQAWLLGTVTVSSGYTFNPSTGRILKTTTNSGGRVTIRIPASVGLTFFRYVFNSWEPGDLIFFEVSDIISRD